MKKRWITVLLVLLFAVTLVAGLGVLPNKALAKDKPIIIKFPTIVPKAPPSIAPVSQAIALLGKSLEEKSGGRFDVKQYWSASLYRDDEVQYAALRDNVIQLAFSAGGRMGGQIPEINILGLPFSFKNFEHYRRFFHGPKGFKLIGGPGAKLLEPLFAKKGYKYIATITSGFRNFVCSKRFLATPEDFKGIKFRITPSKLAQRVMETFGSSGQAIPYMETYTALQLKTVDAAECPLSIIQAVKWHETGNYITLSRHSNLTSQLLANPAWYNGLPEDLKKVFNECVEEFLEFLYIKEIDYDQRMPMLMMSEVPSLKFKYLTEKERAVLKKQAKPVIDHYKKEIPKEFWDALEASEPK
ncbi:MAG: TRAP transporter substrate-binding protein [Desulfobacteraceae bacterium]|nr:TRAP transporter substrate-binding protein [Desulfobacteraceae bacterium]